MNSIQTVTVHELADWIYEKAEIVILDVRSFMEYNTSHIGSAINIGGDRAFRRKLAKNPNVLSSLVSSLAHLSTAEITRNKGLILYDQCSDDQGASVPDSFLRFIVDQLVSNFSNTLLLKGGFCGFKAVYPEFCWQHSAKLPDEEYVHVQSDSGLEATLDECLTQMMASNTGGTSIAIHPSEPFCRLDVRNESTSSYCESVSSDSGIASGASVEVSRMAISRASSAPTQRPSVGSKVRSRVRPITLDIGSSLNVDTSAASFSRSLSRSPLLPPSGNGKQLTANVTPISYRHAIFASSINYSGTPSISSTVHAPLKSKSDIRRSYSGISCFTERLCSADQSRLSASNTTSAPSYSRQSSREATHHRPIADFGIEVAEPTRILPHLVLGCQSDAMSVETCREYNITHVINVSLDGAASPNIPENNFLRIPIQDTFSDEITPFFDEAFSFLNSSRSANGCVLVHCAAGISRSPTLAIAYLMQTCNMTMNEAYNKVKSLRPSISPNFNFLGQLKAFEIRRTNTHKNLRPASLSDCRPESIMDTSSSLDTQISNVSSFSHRPTLLKLSQRSISRPSLVKIGQSPTLQCASRRLIQLVHRPTLDLHEKTTLENRATSSLTLNCSSPKKRERPQQLSLFPSSSLDMNADKLVSVEKDVKSDDSSNPSLRKRSRISELLPSLNFSGSLLPSPSSAIAQLDLSSPSEDMRKLLQSSTPSVQLNAVPKLTITCISPPPSRLRDGFLPATKRRLSLSTDSTHDLELKKNISPIGIPRNWYFSQSFEKLNSCLEVKKNTHHSPLSLSEIDDSSQKTDEVMISHTSQLNSHPIVVSLGWSLHTSPECVLSSRLAKSASNPLISQILPEKWLTSSPSHQESTRPPSQSMIIYRTDFNRPNILGEASCRQQESCHISTSSSISSSSNGQTPSFTVS